MTGPDSESLRRILLLDYDGLKTRLAKRLGSAELAGDALQDTWLRLQRSTLTAPVARPRPYLLQIAYRAALKRLQRERRAPTLDDARAVLELADDAPDSERVVEARAALAQLRAAVDELTPRRRDILFASRLDGTPLHELAQRHGISQRMVERELKQAVLHCAARLERNVVQRFGPRPRQGSTGKDHESGEAGAVPQDKQSDDHEPD